MVLTSTGVIAVQRAPKMSAPISPFPGGIPGASCLFQVYPVGFKQTPFR